MSKIAGRIPLVIEPLQKSQLRQAYPLLQSSEPGLALGQWMREARRLTRCSSSSGALTARWAQRPYLAGVACYRSQWDSQFGRVLVIPRWAVLDMVHPEYIAEALIDSLEQCASAMRCSALKLLVRPNQQEAARLLLEQGHYASGVLLTKDLSALSSDIRLPN